LNCCEEEEIPLPEKKIISFSSTMEWSEILPRTGYRNINNGARNNNNNNNNNDRNINNNNNNLNGVVGVGHHHHHNGGGNMNNNNHNNNNNNGGGMVDGDGGGGGRGGGSSSSSSNAPTIKNHSVTHFGDYLYCFGGYDGRRNHATLLLYSLKEEKWIRPLHIPGTGTGGGGNHDMINNNNNPAQEGAEDDHNDDDNDDDDGGGDNEIMGHEGEDGDRHNGDDNGNNDEEREDGDNDEGEGDGNDDDGVVQQAQLPPAAAAAAAVPIENADGGAGGRRGGGGVDADLVDIVVPPLPTDPTTVIITGNPPPGRNGHSATLAVDPDDPDCGCIIIIGGWLGTGPLAASDMHVLHIRNNRNYPTGSVENYIDDSDDDTVTMSNAASNANDDMELDNRQERLLQRRLSRRQHQLQQQRTATIQATAVAAADLPFARPTLRWSCPAVRGTPPGPCNMHSADYVKRRQEVYVFRGGNGREYLNDLHALCTQTFSWRRVETTGEIPQQRANHSSAVLDETGELFIFGGWYVFYFIIWSCFSMFTGFHFGAVNI
jgi:Kelch motif